MGKWQDRYIDRFYRSRPGWVDGTTEFHALCRATILPGSHILEIGAGPTNSTSAFLATVGLVDGVDIDAAVLKNEHLKKAAIIERDHYPYPDSVFDACVSNYVLEHVQDPLAHFREVRRVLVPGGCYVFRTPNKFYYVSLVARLTPHWFHKLLANPLRNLPKDQIDPYPTYYACNSQKDVARFAFLTDFTVEHLRLIEKEPSYGMQARPLFLGMMAYERLVNSTERLADLRANLLVVLRRVVSVGAFMRT